jgi:hypothetical protein
MFGFLKRRRRNRPSKGAIKERKIVLLLIEPRFYHAKL